MNKKLWLSMATGIALAMPIAAYAAGDNSLTSTSSYSDLMANVNAPTAMAVDLSKTPTSVRIYKISSLKGYKAGDAALKSAMTSNASIKGLDAKIAASADLTSKLKAKGFKPTDVVAVSSDTSGGIILFVNA
jgi:hypothetical protein